MGAITREQFIITPAAQLAMDRYAIPNPVDAAMKFDIDVDAIREQLATLDAAKQAVGSARETLPQSPPDTWGGDTADAWTECTVTFWNVLLHIWDFLVWFAEALIWFIDLIIEAIRWLGETIDFLLGLISVIGTIDMLLEANGVRVPRWIRTIFKILKIVEKAPKLIIAVVAAAALVIALLGKYIDQFLDWVREGIRSYRRSIESCLGRGPEIEDEPIGPAPIP
ncbi:MAG: hypothetical protein L0G99_14645 [Propionibacteriales bacterium]|nr:hypothetical protein [Propionibacteriales bacterium]